MQQGQKAPSFHLSTTRGDVSLEELLKGGKLIVAFYLEDGTPG